MRKKLLSSVFLFLLLNLLIKPFWILGIDVTVQNTVGAEEYGLYFAIFNFSFIFSILLDLGITNFNNRNIAQHNHLIGKHLSGIIGIKLLLLLLFVIVTFGIGYVMGYESQQFHLLAWICFNQFLSSFILYLRSNFSSLLLFKTDSFLSVLDRILMILFCSLLLWGHVIDKPFRIEWFIWAQTASYSITAMIALISLMYKTKLRRLTLNIPFSIMIIKKSLPFALLVLLMASYNRIDSIMLERILPNAQGDMASGIYASAFRLLDALVMLSYLVSIPLLPIYAKMLKDKENIAPITQMIFTFMFVFVTAIAITFSFLSSQLMNMLYDNHIEESAAIFRILIFGFIPISITYIFGTLLTANNNLKLLNLLSFGTLLINIVINLMLIPKLGAMGSAYASLTAQSVVAVTQIIFVFRIFRFPIRYNYLFKIGMFVIGILLCNIVASYFQCIWWLQIAVIGCVALTLTFVLRLFRMQDIIRILKEE